ncbi:ABC transporter ATP-binding protein [Saccharibacillus sp. JS10]|uniref:ABC transporter ATP-binding protein n=1 Tax=Saccharibacillus sp. JS10 TaxID=2950552 RepID=UPI002108D4E7|nr:ABC transporter ATP-binding protein [Saccharibacillus sp. JS10]MCQ4088050.1 ABC transporter ATP-binding protein/permease [Saccharibacillus sp. JS10]
MSEQKNNAAPPRKGPGPGMGMGPGGMGMPVAKPKNFKGTFKRLVGYLAPYKFHLLIVLITAILSTLFNILGPKIMSKAVTRLTEGVFAKLQGVPGAAVDFEYIWQIIMILAGLYVASALFGYIQQFVMAGVAQRTSYGLRKEVKEKLDRLPLKYYDNHPYGDVLSRVTNDMDNISNTLQQSLTQIITSLVTIIGVIIMMLTISPIMTLIVVLTIPLSLVVVIMIAKRSQKYFAGQQRALGDLNGHVEEMYNGHRVIKAYGREENSQKKFEQHNKELYESGWKAQYISGLIMPLMSFIGNIGYVLICVVGGIFATNGRISIGDILAFIQYSRQFTQPITQTANIANVIQSAIASAERVFEILDEEEQVPDRKLERHMSGKGAVTFKQVDFGYSQEKLLIENMNIDVAPGQTVAIVGPTGAGKTTLINLLMRFYEINGGAIEIDGVDTRDLDRDRLRSLFGMVLQDTWLFGGTIRENIAYGREGATEEEIVRAAEAARADHFIRTLPDGYDTVLNEDASNISQGQKQLLTIARAVLADPRILILDEATSSVDTRTEIFIQQAMGELMQNRTSFVIAHRLSTIKGADLILVMNQGKVIEQGTHDELLNASGFYADLYNSQFSEEAG